jgi:hypothetical protein
MGSLGLRKISLEKWDDQKAQKCFFNGWYSKNTGPFSTGRYIGISGAAKASSVTKGTKV